MGSATIQGHLRGTGPHDPAQAPAETLARSSCGDLADADVEPDSEIESCDLLRRQHASGSFGIASRFELARYRVPAIAGVACSQKGGPAR